MKKRNQKRNDESDRAPKPEDVRLWNDDGTADSQGAFDVCGNERATEADAYEREKAHAEFLAHSSQSLPNVPMIYPTEHPL